MSGNVKGNVFTLEFCEYLCIRSAACVLIRNSVPKTLARKILLCFMKLIHKIKRYFEKLQKDLYFQFIIFKVSLIITGGLSSSSFNPRLCNYSFS